MRSSWIALALLLFGSACGKGDKPPPPSQAYLQQESAPAAKRGSADNGATRAAQETFARVCSMCHGADGTGTGPAAESLNPKPRNYTDPAWQASVTDDEIKRIVVQGGAAVGKSPSMPPNPDLKDDPETLDALVKLIRGFAKK